MSHTSHTVLSYGFVGLWSTELPEVPLLEQADCEALFDEQMRLAVTAEGLSVTVSDGRSTPSAIVNTKRLQVVAPTPGAVAKALSQLVDLLGFSAPGPVFSMIGWNIEHEFSGLDKSGPIWLGELLGPTFASGDIKALFGYGIDLGFASAGDKHYFLTLQPREGVENAIFCRVNDTTRWDPKWELTTGAVLQMLRESLENTVKNVFPMLKVGP
ncbi:MAG: hypothetical protein ACRDKE_09280 [Solirubrobacterales bacterium]